MELFEIIQEYALVIDDIYGLYLDACHGFILNKEEMIESQKQTFKEKGILVEQLDKKPIVYGVAVGNNPASSYSLHECSQGDFKLRNSRNGINSQQMANMCLCQIYDYWEDHYRNIIAKLVGKKENEIKSDILGDVRQLRESIVHHRGYAIKTITKNKIIQKFNPGDKIEIDEHLLEAIIELIKTGLGKLLAELLNSNEKSQTE